MKEIILSIKPQYVERIINGTKKFEYRTRIPKSNINKIIIYSSYPVKKIIAEVDVLKVLKLITPEELWESTKDFGGIDKSSYDKYFEGRDIAYAYKLGEIKEFIEPKSLNDYGINYAPQSFIYI